MSTRPSTPHGGVRRRRGGLTRSQPREPMPCEGWQAIEERWEIAGRVSDQNGMPLFLSTAAEAPHRADTSLPRTCCREATGELRKVQRGQHSGAARRVGVVAPWRPGTPEHHGRTEVRARAGRRLHGRLKPSPETVLDAILVGEAALQAGCRRACQHLPGGGRPVHTSLPTRSRQGVLHRLHRDGQAHRGGLRQVPPTRHPGTRRQVRSDHP